jgi:23S rRNA (adenine2030-N6)-methyltransferase
MAKQLQNLPGIEWLQADLVVKQSSQDQHGLYGSGMLVINPPYTLKAQLETTLPWLSDVLAQDDHAQWRLRQGKSAR